MDKKFIINSNTTFGQARIRGITKKNFLRRQRISISLKKTYERKRIILSQKIPTKKKEVQKTLITRKRIRKQVVLNLRSHDEPYAISIRAITINPIITENGLKIAVNDGLKRSGYKLRDFYQKRYYGLEETEISNEEDKRLNDYRVHIEILIKKNRPINYKI